MSLPEMTPLLMSRGGSLGTGRAVAGRWATEPLPVTSASEAVGGSYSPSNTIYCQDRRERWRHGPQTGPWIPPQLCRSSPYLGLQRPVEVVPCSVGRKGPRGGWKQAQVLDGKVEEGEAISTMSGSPRHTGRCGRPRQSGVQWWTPLRSPEGRFQSTRPTTGAIWHRTSGLGSAGQGRSRGHLVGWSEFSGPH